VTIIVCPPPAGAAGATRARAAGPLAQQDQCTAPEVTVVTSVSASQRLFVQACNSCVLERREHSTTGATGAQEPFDTISQAFDEATATASGQASGVVTGTTGTVVTITGTVQASGTAEVQGVIFGVAESNPSASVLASLT
jgi:hypothetical protein